MFNLLQAPGEAGLVVVRGTGTELPACPERSWSSSCTRWLYSIGWEPEEAELGAAYAPIPWL